MDLAERMAHNVELVSALAESASTVGGIIEATLDHPGKRLAASYGALLGQISRQMSTTVERVQDMKAIGEELRELVGVVNRAGRQRMLSQRALRGYLLSRLQPDRRDHWLSEVEGCGQVFREAHESLVECNFNTPQLQENLRVCLQTWTKFQNACQGEDFELVLQWNDTLLAELELLVGNYQGLISQR